MQITLFIDSRQNGEIEGVLFSAVSRRRPPNTPVAQPTSAFKSGLFVYTKNERTRHLFFSSFFLLKLLLRGRCWSARSRWKTAQREHGEQGATLLRSG